MNTVTLIGHITAKPELRYTNSNKAVTSFSIAINSGYEDNKRVDFIRIQAWNKTAENICTFLDKGSQIAILGSIRTSHYEDKDGNKRIDTYVLANQIKFLGKSEKVKIEPNTQESTIEEDNDPFADFGESVTIEDDFLD